MTSREREKDAAICHTRKPYRAGRRLTAVKAYTVAQESRYLIVRNVPALRCVEDLIKLFALYGPIEEYRTVDEEREPFTEVVWIKFCHVANARFAKRKMDDAPFMGALLDISYGLGHESVGDTRQKLEERVRTVARKVKETDAQGGAVVTNGTAPAGMGPLQPPSAPRVITDATGLLPVAPPRPSRMPPHAFGGPACGPGLAPREVEYHSAPPMGVSTGIPDRVVEAALAADIQRFEAPSMNRVVQDVRSKLSRVSRGEGGTSVMGPRGSLHQVAATSIAAAHHVPPAPSRGPPVAALRGPPPRLPAHNSSSGLEVKAAEVASTSTCTVSLLMPNALVAVAVIHGRRQRRNVVSLLIEGSSLGLLICRVPSDFSSTRVARCLLSFLSLLQLAMYVLVLVSTLVTHIVFGKMDVGASSNHLQHDGRASAGSQTGAHRFAAQNLGQCHTTIFLSMLVNPPPRKLNKGRPLMVCYQPYPLSEIQASSTVNMKVVFREFRRGTVIDMAVLWWHVQPCVQLVAGKLILSSNLYRNAWSRLLYLRVRSANPKQLAIAGVMAMLFILFTSRVLGSSSRYSSDAMNNLLLTRLELDRQWAASNEALDLSPIKKGAGRVSAVEIIRSRYGPRNAILMESRELVELYNTFQHRPHISTSHFTSLSISDAASSFGSRSRRTDATSTEKDETTTAHAHARASGESRGAKGPDLVPSCTRELCEPHGRCEASKCVCAALYTGPFCKEAKLVAVPSLLGLGARSWAFDDTFALNRRSLVAANASEVVVELLGHEADHDRGHRVLGPVNDKLLKVLPPEDPFGRPMWPTCAVVGNSGALLGRSFGPDIDDHDMIMRFDSAPTAGYEGAVGTRTTHRLTNSQNWVFHEATKEVLLVPLRARPSLEALVRVRETDPSIKVAGMAPPFTEYAARILDNASLGLMGLLVAAQKCRSIDVYGMQMGHAEGVQYLYYNVCEQPVNKTRDAQEWFLLSALADVGVVNIKEPCTTDCHTSSQDCDSCKQRTGFKVVPYEQEMKKCPSCHFRVGGCRKERHPSFIKEPKKGPH
eukprot:jgi/Mesvir1/25035/Mv16974-RA.1